MSDVKREIIFAESMTIDKRNVDFAYLRKNVFKARTKGLYPARDFHEENPDGTTLTDAHNIRDILGRDEALQADIKVFVENAGNLQIYELGSNSVKDTIVGVDYECGAYGDDGVHIVCDDDDVYGVGETSSIASSDGTFLQARPDIGGFDGLYYWWLSGNEIYRQLDNNAPTVAFNNIGIQPRFVGFNNDQMIIFCQVGYDIVVLFWDKSDTDLFDKRVIVRNAKLIAGGVIDGTIMLVKGIGNSSNPKEQDGEIVICAYDGERFARLNSIKAGRREVEYENVTGVGIGSEVMAFSVDGNYDDANSDLYKDFIYKVYADGAIEVVAEPDRVNYAGEIDIVRVFYNFICYAESDNNTGLGQKILTNEATNQDFGDYENYTTTEYITNFLNNPYNDHKLDGFMVAFEKLFEQTDEVSDPQTGEELDVYYRVSERDDWTLLMNVTAEKVKDYVNQFRDQTTEYNSDTTGLPEQRYAVSMMPDGETPLPEYNEIQFKFVSKRGFSIIGAWYRYSYVSRNSFE